MITGLFSTTQTLLSVIPEAGGELRVQHACVRGKKILAVGEGMPSPLTGVTRASVFSLESYFEQVDLAAASVKLLPLVARRHIDAELVFDDAMYRLRACSRAKTERTIAADLAAVPERDLEAAVSQLPLQQRPCEQMVPLELAIAALVSQVTDETVLVFWEKGGVLISLLAAGGMVQSRMREMVGDDNRDLVLQRADASLRAAASRSGDGGEALPALYCGELVDHHGAADERAGLQLERRLSRLFRSARGVAGNAVLRDPELYGLPFVAQEWSFLEADYGQQVQSWRYARPAAAAAAVVGLALGLYGGARHLQAMSIASDFDQQRSQLSADMAEFERTRPGDQAMAAVRDRLRIHQQSGNEVRLDRMLDWLTHLLPEGVAIKGLEMAPTPVPRQRSRVAPRPFPPGEKPFDVRVHIVLGEASLDAAEASAAEIVRRLSQRLQMVGSRLEVPAPEPGAGRNVVLVVRAQARAVNFS